MSNFTGLEAVTARFTLASIPPHQIKIDTRKAYHGYG